MQQCWSLSNVCILSVCTFIAGLIVVSECLSVFCWVFSGFPAKRLVCDDEMSLYTY